MVDAVPTPTPTPLLDAIRARAEICVLRTTLSAEMACGVCAANVRCLELERVCMRIDLVLSSSIDHTVSFYDDSDVLTPSLFSTAPLNRLSFRVLALEINTFFGKRVTAADDGWPWRYHALGACQG